MSIEELGFGRPKFSSTTRQGGPSWKVRTSQHPPEIFLVLLLYVTLVLNMVLNVPPSPVQAGAPYPITTIIFRGKLMSIIFSLIKIVKYKMALIYLMTH